MSFGTKQCTLERTRNHCLMTLVSTFVSHVSSEPLSVSVCLSAGCLGLSPHLGHLSPRAHQPLIGADRTRYPPTLLHQPSVLPYILWTTSFIISFGYLRTTSWLMRRHSLKVANLLKLATLSQSITSNSMEWLICEGRFVADFNFINLADLDQ